ncbi:MAG: F-type H+-transporting ATPase subunit a [Salibacteraceae bacterium]|jgi:F-type H+-transporting ATPase subunit a
MVIRQVIMQFTRALFFLAVLVLMQPVFLTASEHSEHASDSTESTQIAYQEPAQEGMSMKQEIKAHIQHHLQDGHDFHLYTDTETNTHVGFPLPVILLDDGVQVFSSSRFHHGESVAESNGKFYALHHGKVYKTDAAGTFEMHDGHVHNEKPLDFSITKNVFSIMAFALMLILLFTGAARSYKKSLVPSGSARFLEPLIIFVRDEIAIPNIGEKHYKRFMSYLLTVFFFIWLVNLFGLTPLGINVTNSISVTFALAVMTFVITQFSGKKEYWKHIFWMPGVPVPMKILLAPIELLGVFIKPFALLIRLYANITAGHIVLMSLIGLMFIFHSWIGSTLSFGLSVFISFIELLVAALQAYIFTMLTALYFGSAVAEHEDH